MTVVGWYPPPSAMCVPFLTANFFHLVREINMLLPPPKALLLAALQSNPLECLPATSGRPHVLLLGGTRNLRVRDVCAASAWYGGGRVHRVLHPAAVGRHAELRLLPGPHAALGDGVVAGRRRGRLLAALLQRKGACAYPRSALWCASRGRCALPRW